MPAPLGTLPDGLKRSDVPAKGNRHSCLVSIVIPGVSCTTPPRSSLGLETWRKGQEPVLNRV